MTDLHPTPPVPVPAAGSDPGATDASSWHDPARVEGFLDRSRQPERSAWRVAGEEVLRTLLPTDPRRLLDLGCGDGRLASLVIDERPGLDQVVLVDSSPPMLDEAGRRFARDPRVTVLRHDLGDPLPTLGRFDVVVSGLAIHHLDDQRKRLLLSEVAALLTPGGLFANLEVVTSGSARLHTEFLDLIGRPDDDPEDRLADVGSQLGWMRQAGLRDVDCLWRWRGVALLVGWAAAD
jgi:tRNA (cmo5U34)-methyltransferase